MKITIRLAHPPGSKLHPPTPSPKMGEEEPEGLKVPLPPWERDLAIQLAIEYDPDPPFQSGSLQKADQKTVQQSRKLLRSWFLDEFQKFFPDQAIPKL